MSLMPPPLKETLPAEEVILRFLGIRQADRDLIVDSRCNVRAVTRVRHELMWLLRDLTHLSLVDIGKLLGGRDGTTVQHGVDQVSDRIAADADYRREMLFQRNAVLRGDGSGLTPDLRLRAARGILADASLTDTEARRAALQLMGGNHG